MIVSITEQYTNGTPVHWFCELEQASPEFQEIVRKAIANGGDGVLRRLGFQYSEDTKARIHPPCMVDAEVELWEARY
jgi:hypothetical protein